VKWDEILDMVIVSVMALPQVGHMTWSACEVGGAEEEVPLLLCVHANILAVSRLDGRPSSDIVIGEGMRPTTVPQCDTDGVRSSSGVSMFILSPLVVIGVTLGVALEVPFFIG